MKCTSVEDLERIRNAGNQSISPDRIKISVGTATCGLATGAGQVYDAIVCEVGKRGLDYIIARTGCLGFCQKEPLVEIYQPGLPRIIYQSVNTKMVPELVAAVTSGTIRKEWALCLRSLDGEARPQRNEVPLIEDVPFFSKQVKVVMRNCGLIDPDNIAEYIARGGYFALQQVLSGMSPDEVIETVTKSGLRGRGGAGFPTGTKWGFARCAPGYEKFVICNADEGDPGAYMDRSILEGDPHAVLEGMIIGAYAIGACKGYIYIRDEYPLAVERFSKAVSAAREHGLLGRSIMGSDFNFDVYISKGAGAFVCGEETSLIASIEGRSGEPRQRPPFPAQSGLWNKPTNINNVETWASVSAIIRRGADWYSGIGTDTSKGTKVFSIVGQVKNTGLVEVPMGLTLREMVFDIGGGVFEGRKFKAVQTGGPSGGCIPEHLLDLPVDYEKLTEAGAIMGSGGMIVMDDRTCMVDVAHYFLDFLSEESCGKCVACREGIERLLQILENICAGKGREGDIELLGELAQGVKDFSLCALGGTAPNSVLTTLRYFREEYEAHIKNKRCDAFVCKELVGAPCQSACPLGTEAWRYVAHIARGEYEDAYRAIREPNPFPSVCARVCHNPCEERCRAGTSEGSAIAIRALKRFITDRFDPSVYKPERVAWGDGKSPRVAVIGSGPAGLTAAHYLSLKGCKVTVFEAESQPGGMLFCAIPSYRLPRDVIEKEIDSLLDENITLKCNTALGRDITVDGLFEDGYKAVFLALGAHKSRPLRLEDEDVAGVYPSIEFLKAFNMRGEQLARGRVGVVGGGNSAVDAARTALRQKDVDSVTILYRRTRDEMPAFAEEIEAADQEGIDIQTLVTPTKVITTNGRLSGLECIRNELGDVDSSGRRRPVPIKGTEHVIELDTLVVAISEDPEIDAISQARSGSIETTKYNTIQVDSTTLLTNRSGVFAGGDVVTGPNTVVEAIADGKKAALMIERYLRNEELVWPSEPRLPRVYVEPVQTDEEGTQEDERAETPRAPAEWRKRNFAEVEVSFSVEEATREACRCLRCDLEFTKPKEVETETEVRHSIVGEK